MPLQELCYLHVADSTSLWPKLMLTHHVQMLQTDSQKLGISQDLGAQSFMNKVIRKNRPFFINGNLPYGILPGEKK